MYDRSIVEDTYNNQEPSMNIVPNPWRRYFARTFDVSIYSLIITIVLLYVFRVNTEGNGWAQYIEIIAAGIIMLFVEPLLLATIGTTPGKWIFGLRLRNDDGGKIPYLQGFWRTMYIIKEGYGFNIPIYNLYRSYKSYQTCSNHRELSWDYGFSYQLKDSKGVRIAGYVGSMALVLGLTVVVSLHARLPINRGNISPQEYFENCNDFAKIHNVDFGEYLNEEGQWVEKPSYGTYTIWPSAMDHLPHEVVYENDQIQKVIIEIETSADNIIYSKSSQLVMAYSAFVGSDQSINAFELYNSESMDHLKASLSNFSFEIEDYRVTNTVEHSGFNGSDQLLFPEDEKEHYFHLKFVIERL